MKILVVDDETAILETLEILFRGEGYEVLVADSGPKALAALEDEKPDIVLTDIRMPGAGGLDVLSEARAVDPEIPVILMTAQASLQTAVRAVNEGAYYYLQKPFANEELLAICRRAAEARALRAENKRLKKEIKKRSKGWVGRPIGVAPRFVEVLELAETVAATGSTVLISGESGTGKEVVARYIHELSDRSDGAFMSINCGALPESLLESELFGHVKGSFTGAVRDKDGLLVAAAGGTFFLDEIAEMSPSTQVKLLRAIQEREVIPVGSTKTVSVDVRIIAATNRDLEEAIMRGSFRSDLYYRLNVIQLHLPPLRERTEDVPMLARYFLGRLNGEGEGGEAEGFTLADETLEALVRYDWPGNVRELENALERAAVLSTTKAIRPAALPDRVLEAPRPRLAAEEAPSNPTMEVVERAYI
ncbi:MAG TPA: sigma-54 dependent transcriptional regulator, partial [Longimicrobiales bacterium]|nr:sigma-54 dependent transcriptional regulator [Longimicrobiales bacterium]